LPGRETVASLTSRPESVDQAVDLLVKQLRLKDKSAIAHLQRSQLESLLQALDHYLEDEFALGRGNDRLMAACRQYLKEKHVAETEPAMAIITELWNILSKTHRLRLVK
jgi:hypothetical protein